MFENLLPPDSGVVGGVTYLAGVFSAFAIGIIKLRRDKARIDLDRELGLSNDSVELAKVLIGRMNSMEELAIKREQECHKSIERVRNEMEDRCRREMDDLRRELMSEIAKV